MKPIKRMMLRLFLLLEVVVFGYIYLFGNNGLHILTQRRQEALVLEQEIQQLACQIEVFEAEIDEWDANDFYKEKIAREQLQMARKDDEIYYVS